MNKQWFIILVLLVGLSLASAPGVVHTSAVPLAPVPSTSLSLRNALQNQFDGVSASAEQSSDVGASLTNSGQALPKVVSADWWATAQEEIRESEYHVTWQEKTHLLDVPAAYQAPNRAHNLRTYFTPDGIRVIPRTEATPTWEWGLTLTGYGYIGSVWPVRAAKLVAEDNRVEYRRGTLTEWYVNDERGLEQGFTLVSPPAGAEGDALLQIDLALTGNLTPNLSGDPLTCLLYTSPSPRDRTRSRMPSSA